MTLVKFIKENRGDAAQLRILNELSQEDSFGHEANPGAIRRNVFEANLVADFFTEPAVALGSDSRSEEASREPAWLQNYDLPDAKRSMIEQNLRDLGGFPRASRRLDDQSGAFFQLGDERVLELENGQVLARHRRGTSNAERPTSNVQ